MVLDYNGNPLRNFRALPATISSKEDGCFLEGMLREDPRMSWDDMAARMPWREIADPTLPPSSYHLQFMPCVSNNTGGMRRLRFRVHAGCIAWTEREGSENLQTLIEAEGGRANKECGQKDQIGAHGR